MKKSNCLYPILFLLAFYSCTFNTVKASTITQDSLSLFDHIYQIQGIPHLEIHTDVNKLINHNLEEIYQDLKLEVIDTSNNKQISLNGQIRPRGNTRKKISHLPPVKLKLKDADLAALGLVNSNKLKLVFPTSNTNYFEELLKKEFLLYEIYNQIEPNYLRTKLLHITLFTKGKREMQFMGFLIENKEEYKRRMKAIAIDKGISTSAVFDKKSFSKMVLFQYMIANTDWSIEHKHNLEFLKLPTHDRLVAMPYDFDYSGFVGQTYAIPHPIVPIKKVDERFFYPQYKLDEVIYDEVVEYYLSMEEEIFTICDNADYLKPRTIKKSKAYIASFFDLLRDASKLVDSMVKND